MKRKIICLLSVILVLVFCGSLAACDDYFQNTEIKDEYFKNVNMPLVYQIYLDYTTVAGETPLTYEEWFNTVHGDEFQKGIIPEIRKNDTTDFWEISYNNGQGWYDLKFKTETAAQKNCNHSFGQWVTICEANEYFNGIRYRNCNQCNYKNYQFKFTDDICLHSELVNIDGKPSTCTAQGLTDGKKCAKCGEIIVKQKIINKLDHVIVIDRGIEATCTTTGLTEGSHCSECGKILVVQREIPVNEHNYINRVCIECGDTSQYSIGLSYTLNDDGTCSVTGIGTCADTEVYIPPYFGIYKVTSINDAAFIYCNNLTSIIIPDSVTSIGDAAFSDCKNLVNIEISDSIIKIGCHAFYNCIGLIYSEYDNAYYIGNNSNPYLVLIKAKDQAITSCKIHPNTKVIYHDAFYWCTNLERIVIPDGVTDIGFGAFQVCSNLVKVVIPDSVINIADSAFWGCSGLTSIEIPAHVISIGESVLNGCHNLESITVEKENTVYHSAGNCLIETASKTIIASCKNSIIPTDSSVIHIGDHAFALFYTNLTSITIPNNITSIGDTAFAGCYELTSIVIPNSVTSIGDGAFYYCSSLTSITFEGTIAQWNAVSKGIDWNNYAGDFTVYCTDGTATKDGAVTYN